MIETIRRDLLNSVAVKQAILADAAVLRSIEEAATLLKKSVQAGGLIFSCGNGGSACDAMHFTEELVARYKRERPGIRALHGADGGTVTCWSNDYSFESVYERQVTTFCGQGDVVVGISTSGNSKNVIKAMSAAKLKGASTIGLLGKDGGALRNLCDVSVVVPGKETERIQEAHITIIHIWCELLET